MADVFTPRKSDGVLSVPAPIIQGVIIPSADMLNPTNSLGLSQPIGFGMSTRRFIDGYNAQADTQESVENVSNIVNALNVPSRYAEALRFEISATTGPPGIQGPPGATIFTSLSGLTGGAGVSGKTVVLSATQQIFKYDGDGIIVAAQTITFTANTDNCTGDHTWAIKSPIGSTVRAFTAGGGVSDTTATLSGADFDGWAQANAEISVTRNGITDTVYIYKIQEGTDVAIAFLTNQNHSFPATAAGVASEYSSGVSEIRAYIGTTQLDYHASNPSTYSLGTLVVTPTGKITITESTVSSQRRLTPSAFDDATDSVIVTVPVVVRNSAGTVTNLSLTLTYGKNKTGATGAAGADAFDDIDIPIPRAGVGPWEGAFTNGTPVTWTSFIVKYKGTDYTVASGSSSNAYFYWDVTAPTVITTTATKSATIGVGKFFVGWNNAGTFSPTNFQKIITAGHVSVTSLTALGLTVADGEMDNLSVNTANIKLLNVTTATIANLNTTTGKIADDATTLTESAYTSGGTAVTTLATVQTVPITSLGNGIDTVGSVTVTASAGDVWGTLYLYHGATILQTLTGIAVASGFAKSYSLSAYNVTGAGAQTYYLKAIRIAPSTGTMTVSARALQCRESKGK